MQNHLKNECLPKVSCPKGCGEVFIILIIIIYCRPRWLKLDAHPTGNQEVAGLILSGSATFFHGD